MRNKSFIFMSLASVLMAAAWLFAAWASTGMTQAKTAALQMNQTEQDLAHFKQELARWEMVGVHALGSVEPVLLDTKFVPTELPKSAQLLAGLYADHGYFNLRHFLFSWNTGNAETNNVATMIIEGEKVFLAQGVPPIVGQAANLFDTVASGTKKEAAR